MHLEERCGTDRGTVDNGDGKIGKVVVPDAASQICPSGAARRQPKVPKVGPRQAQRRRCTNGVALGEQDRVGRAIRKRLRDAARALPIRPSNPTGGNHGHARRWSCPEDQEVAGIRARGPLTAPEHVDIGSGGNAGVGRADVARKHGGADEGRGADAAGNAEVRPLGVLAHGVGAGADGAVVQVRLFEKRQQVKKDVAPTGVGRRRAPREPALGRRQMLAGIVAVVRRQGDLLEVVLALGTVSRLADFLNRRDQQGDQDGDDRDHDQQLDQVEAEPLCWIAHRSLHIVRTVIEGDDQLTQVS